MYVWVLIQSENWATFVSNVTIPSPSLLLPLLFPLPPSPSLFPLLLFQSNGQWTYRINSNFYRNRLMFRFDPFCVNARMRITAVVEEEGRGETQSDSVTAPFVDAPVSLTFADDNPDLFRPGLNYTVKVRWCCMVQICAYRNCCVIWSSLWYPIYLWGHVPTIVSITWWFRTNPQTANNWANHWVLQVENKERKFEFQPAFKPGPSQPLGLWHPLTMICNSVTIFITFKSRILSDCVYELLVVFSAVVAHVFSNPSIILVPCNVGTTYYYELFTAG